MDVLVVVDMQNDFIYGALGSEDAAHIVPAVIRRVSQAVCRGERSIFTRDTHGPDYKDTKEGRDLPVEHCIRDTWGWQIIPELRELLQTGETIDKPTYGSLKLAERMAAIDREEGVKKITLIGVCTDICVLTNAILLRTFLPEAEIEVEPDCCAGTSPQNHVRAIQTMSRLNICIQSGEKN